MSWVLVGGGATREEKTETTDVYEDSQVEVKNPLTGDSYNPKRYRTVTTLTGHNIVESCRQVKVDDYEQISVGPFTFVSEVAGRVYFDTTPYCSEHNWKINQITKKVTENKRVVTNTKWLIVHSEFVPVVEISP